MRPRGRSRSSYYFLGKTPAARLWHHAKTRCSLRKVEGQEIQLEYVRRACVHSKFTASYPQTAHIVIHNSCFSPRGS
jgi:hypothetical protein